MKNPLVLPALVIALVAVAPSCMAPGPIATPGVRLYQPPKAVDEPTAAIAGSIVPIPMWFSGIISFPFAIDNLRVRDASSGWNIPVLLVPGAHVITAEMGPGKVYARADLEFTAEPGHDYLIRFATDATNVNQQTFCEFWIVDSGTGAVVSPLVRVGLLKR